MENTFDFDLISSDNRKQYDSIEDAKVGFIEEYSFNIESRLYSTLSSELQKLWLIDIQHAVKSGIEYGIELSNDEHYK
jgi:hypothetical protein